MFSVFKKRYIISFLICGLILFISYLLSGVLGECLDVGIPPGKAIASVLSSPFADHFNDFTPVLMVLGFVLFEAGWLLVYFKINVFKSNKDPAAMQSNISKEKKNQNVISVENTVDEKTNTDNQPIIENKDIDISAFGFVVPEEVAKLSKETAENSVDESDAVDLAQDMDDEMLSFSSDIFWDLNGEYSVEQIREMAQLKKYMKNIDAAMLRKTFKSALSAAEIKEYIDLFFG